MDKVLRLKRKYFILIIAFSVLFILLSVVLVLIGLDLWITLMLIGLLGIITLLAEKVFQYRFNFYNDYYSYLKLIDTCNDSFSIKKALFTDNWYKKLTTLGYKTYRSFSGYCVYYKFDETKVTKKFDKAAILIVVYFDKTLSFENKNVTKTVIEFEKTFFKSEKYAHRIILQFKKIDTIDNEAKKEASVVQFNRFRKRQFTVVINTVVDDKFNTFFVHSDSFSPNQYYSFGVDCIKKIITNI